MRNILRAAACASLLAACSSSAGDTASTNRAPTDAEYDDAARALGGSLSARTTGDAGAITNVLKISNGIIPLGLNVDADGHIRSNKLGIDIDYSLVCFDAADAALAACNDTSDRADASLAISGESHDTDTDLVIGRFNRWSIDGLRSATAMLDGDGAFDLEAMFDTATYNFHYDAIYDAIAIDTATKRAIGGAAMFEITATTAGGSFALHADLAIHADHTATITLDGDRVYTIEL